MREYKEAIMQPILSISSRIRSTPFTDRVTAAGVKAYTVYNHMLLPTVFNSLEEDYHHLKRNVQVWDVSVERQIELQGPDSQTLIQMITPRDLSKMKDDQCYYIPVVDDSGGMLNDPVAVKHSQNKWWISIADSDLIYWIKGIAVAKNMNVTIIEPDINPLAVQGPKADELMRRVFGDEITSLKFFRHKKIHFNGKYHLVARSGYSKQGGYEIYTNGFKSGEAIWDRLFDAGQNLDVKAGCPNLIERIEGGLLSYGNDMTQKNSPYEAGLGKFCSPNSSIDFIGAEALKKQSIEGPAKQIRGLFIDGKSIPACTKPWHVMHRNIKVGQVTSAAWSPDLSKIVAIGMIDRKYWSIGNKLEVICPSGKRTAEITQLPFIK